MSRRRVTQNIVNLPFYKQLTASQVLILSTLTHGRDVQFAKIILCVLNKDGPWLSTITLRLKQRKKTFWTGKIENYLLFML